MSHPRIHHTILFGLASLLLLPGQTQAEEARPVDGHTLFSVQPPLTQVSAGVTTLVGQVVVMEGDDEIVSQLGGGSYGIDAPSGLQNITQRFYLNYPDEFDGIAIFTTFPDSLSSGFAYSVGPGAGTQGIGFSGYGGEAYGSTSGKLVSVTNMNDTDQYSTMENNDQTFVSVFGQEFTHSWLSFMTFTDPETGTTSNALLGGDSSHWSATFDSGSSVLDGLSYTDNGDGTFTAGDYSTQYGPLDLYAMGIIGPDDVGPLYLIKDAVHQDGTAVDPINDGWTSEISKGTTIRGRRMNFTINDVIDSVGERVPAWDEENEDFRIAFILVTKPGETAAMVSERADKLNAGRLSWEKAHTTWANKLSTMCTDISTECPLAAAEILDVQIMESPKDSDEDGILEPGEKIRIAVTLENSGILAANAHTVLTSDNEGVNLPKSAVETDTIAPGETYVQNIDITIDGSACGETIDVDVTTNIEHRLWRGGGSFRPGVLETSYDPFETDAGWVANKGGVDTASNGEWEFGVPEKTFFAGRELQPDGGAGGAGDSAWFTGPLDPWNLGEVGGGATTLQSASYDLSKYTTPTLQFKLWYLAVDRTPVSIDPTAESHLTIEGSSDGGKTWVVLEEVLSDPVRWELHVVPLDKLDTDGDVVFRFTAFDQENDQRLVEVGIDDIGFGSFSGSCDDTGGCGCTATGRETAGGWLLGFLVIVLLRRRRALSRTQ